MQKGKTLTLKNTNERIDKIEDKLEKILNLLSTPKEDVEREIKVYEFNSDTLVSNCNNPKEFLDKVESLSIEFTDDYDNDYVKLPTIWVKVIENQITFSFEEFDDSFILIPQAISKYKNSLIDGKIRSIANHAPDFTQFSFNKASKFCSWVEGEQLNWKTVLYIQIIWAYAYQTKKNDDILPNENHNWSTERDCAFGDTGNHIGEFLGIEQLFTSGRAFVSFEGRECYQVAWDLYKKWNYNANFNPEGRYGIWGDYNKDDDSHAAFFSVWYLDFYDAWYCNYGAVRLCKSSF